MKEISKHPLDKKPEVVSAWQDGRSRPRLKKQVYTALFSFGNVAAVALLLLFVASSQNRPAETLAVLSVSDASSPVKPLDQISSADIAVNLARLGNFEEVYQVAIQASAVEYLSEQPAANEAIAEKPQVVNSTIRTRKDITTYIAVEGDTVSSIASLFSVNANSIRWSNDLSGDKLSAGTEVTVPPQGLDGIVYEVQESDTVDSLAKKYSADKNKLAAFNDIEGDVLPVGELIFMPEAEKPAPVRTVARATTSRTIPINGEVQSGGYTPLYGANGYVFGHCTYYVATRIGAPNGLGNARTWDDRAGAYGYTVVYTSSGGRPVAGGIAGRDSGSFGYGHVAVVEEVSADGTMMKYSDMNGIGGWNRVYKSGWVPVETFDWYLY